MSENALLSHSFLNYCHWEVLFHGVSSFLCNRVCVCVSIPIRTYIYWFDGPGLCENLKMATILFCVFWNNVLVLEKL